MVEVVPALMIFEKPTHYSFGSSSFGSAQHALRRLALYGLLAAAVFSAFLAEAEAQVEMPDRQFLFLEDRNLKRAERQRRLEIQNKQKAVQKTAQQKGLPLDVNATTLDYDAQTKTVTGSGGVILSYGQSIIEAEEASIGVESKDATLKGDVRITDPSGTVAADEMSINLDSGKGSMRNADISFVEGNYRMFAKEALRLGTDTYELTDAELTTCNCPEETSCLPWQIHTDSATVTRGAYGQAYSSTLRACDVPAFYMPYIIFPVKNQRQTGFLPAKFGGGRTGVALQLPFYWAIDRSADMTIMPFIESRARVGVDTELRKIFAQDHTLEMGLIYMNEALRNGDLQGTDTRGLADPTIDEDRFAGYWYHNLNREIAGQNVQFLVDGRYVSDDLFLREYSRTRIDDYNTRFVTSTAVLRTSLFDTLSAGISTEYNQAMVDDDDLIFQRLPEVNIGGFNSLKPFGDTPYGFRTIFSHNLTYTNFTRQERYDGTRADFHEVVKLPFHFHNYFDGQLTADVRASQYSLDNRETGRVSTVSGVEIAEQLPATTDRVVPGFGGGIGTAVERIFPVEDGNPLKFLGELGSQGRQGELVRVKHTIEPAVKYRYVPFVDQLENPQFDSFDRLAKRNLVTYQVTQRLFGKFEARNEYLYGTEETAPELGDIEPLTTNRPVDDSFRATQSERSVRDEYRATRSGARREFASLRLYQSYDVEQERSTSQRELERGIDDNPFSDLGADIYLIPNEYFRIMTRAQLDPDSMNPSAYTFGTQLLDKRGDQLRTRISFIDGEPNPLRQLETSLELRVTDRLKLGYYTRYDDISGKFIENKAGVRFKSACNCWILDFEASERENPTETRFGFNLTLIGLGEFGNNFFSDRRDPPTQ